MNQMHRKYRRLRRHSGPIILSILVGFSMMCFVCIKEFLGIPGVDYMPNAIPLWDHDRFDNLEGCHVIKHDELNVTSNRTCVNRRDGDYLLPCGIGVNPADRQEPHILVIGSTGMIGIPTVSRLRRSGYRVAEIRSHWQFDVSDKTVYKMLKNVNIRAIVNLAHNETFHNGNFTLSHLYKFCRQRHLRIVQPVRNFSDTLKFTIQLKIPPLWGPSFLVINQSETGLWVGKCMRNEPLLIEAPKRLAFSDDVAMKIVEVVNNLVEGKSVDPEIDLSGELPMMRTLEIQKLLRKKGCNIINATFDLSTRVMKTTLAKFNAVWNFAQRQKLPRSHPYTSFVVVASNAPRIVDLFSKVLKAFDEIRDMYPGVPFEIVVVYCPDDEQYAGRFYDVFDVPTELRDCIQVIEIPLEHVISRKELHNITYFPEFDLKNIGIRRARGEFILSANSDIIPPVAFFHTTMKRALSTLSYTRSRRVDVNYSRVNNIINKWFSVQSPVSDQLLYVDVCNDERYYDKYERNGCGDFQGAHREMWHVIKGFLESEYVFHVDTGLSLDFSVFPAMIYARVMGANVHLKHIKQSKMTAHFKFYNTTIKNMIRQGYATSMVPKFSRDNWGAEGVSFTTY